MRSVAVATDQHLMNPLVLRKRSSFHSGEDVFFFFFIDIQHFVQFFIAIILGC